MTDITKKQYVLSSCPLLLENMQKYSVGNMYLYVGEGLLVKERRNAEGKNTILLGNVFCVDAPNKVPEEDIVSFSGNRIISATRFWTGRWVLLSETELVTDASGLMSAFYYAKGDAFCVSSSLALMAEVTQMTMDQEVKADGLSWQLLPGSRLEGVKKLLCTQQIRFEANAMRVEESGRFKKLCALSTDEKCKTLAEMLVNAAKNIHTYSEKSIVLALTGGKDSRLSFAALLKSGIPFSAYTAEHKNMSSSDKTVPAMLCKRFGVVHRFVRRKAYNRELRADYRGFCGGDSNDADARFYAHGQFADFDSETLVIRSGLFEAAQTYARSYTSPNGEGFYRGMVGYYTDLRVSERQRASFDAWYKNATEHPLEGVDIRDRFYVEQRVGGWTAAIEQSLDINDFTSIQIANCEAILSVLLSCSEEERRTLALSYGTIRLLEPRTLQTPINKRSIRDRLLRIGSILKDPFGKLTRFVHKKLRR